MVINNIEKDWATTQVRQIDDHASGVGVFSEKETLLSVKLAEILENYLTGKKCLDVGCGILPMPIYMKLSPSVIYTGIDPLVSDGRLFGFAQGLAEDIPFVDSYFDGILFASTLDHVKDPGVAILEAYRVLKDNGVIIISGSFRNENDVKYKEWLKKRSLSIYNHPWAYTEKSLVRLLHKFTLEKTLKINKQHRIYVFRKTK